MAGRKKNICPIEWHLRNCYRCSRFIRTRLSENGVYDGLVLYTCSVSGNTVAPCNIDGCRHFEYGEPTNVDKDLESKE